jgi:transposase
MGGQRRSYTREFKVEAARLVREGGHSLAQVARDLDVPDSVLWRWVKQYAEDPGQAFPGKGHLKARDEELRRLQRENETLRQERDILKKALAIFSKGPR